MTAIESTAEAATAAASAEKPASGEPPHVERPLRGVLLVSLAVLFFACNDITTKYLVGHYEVPMVAAVRYIIHLLLMVALLGPSLGRRLVIVHRPVLVLVRAACLVASTLFMGLGFQLMPVAESVSIVYLAPLVVVLLARPLLGERIGLLGWLACAAGFCGVLLILRPGGGLDPTGVLYVLGAMVMSVVYYLLSRILARTERTSSLLFYVALCGAIGFGITLPWTLHGVAPGPLELALFLSLGITAALGHFLFTAANRDAPASVLAPIGYTQLIWVGLLSWLFFDHVPDALTIVGMVIVAGAGTLIALKSTRPARP